MNQAQQEVAVNDDSRGLYNKFAVTRTDGGSEPGGKHERCEYFPLDMNHDPFAKPALIAYADACRNTLPQLAEDLMIKVGGQHVLPSFGTFMDEEGGFFLGVVNVDGVRFGYVMAPKAEGELRGAWGKYEAIDARHLSDGVANTAAMAAAGSNLAQQVLALRINGKDDWHIGARDVVELMYRHGKPTDRENYCSFRDGENPSSVPMGGLYTEESPAQTTAAEYREGGSEAFETSGWYWTSTQSSADGAFVQDFSAGDLNGNGKGNEWRVRAVRRFLIN